MTRLTPLYNSSVRLIVYDGQMRLVCQSVASGDNSAMTRWLPISLALAAVIAGPSPALAAPIKKTDHLTAGIFLELAPRAQPPAGTVLRPIYPKGLQATQIAEGWSSTPYEDVAGYCTIGYGHLLRRGPCSGSDDSQFGRGISRARGADLLVTDMASVQWAVMSSVKVPLTDGQYAALCDFAFNVGLTNFSGSTLLKVVNQQRFDQVPFQLRRWTYAGGKEVRGLKNRRELEIDLFFDGVLKPKGVPVPGEDLSPIDVRTGERS